MQNNDKDNFSLGFIVGILVAIVMFFLTETSEGKEIKEKTLEEWEVIKKTLKKEGIVIENKSNPIQILTKIREKISDFLGEDFSSRKNKAIGKGRRGRKTKLKVTDKETTVRKSKKKIFKGI